MIYGNALPKKASNTFLIDIQEAVTINESDYDSYEDYVNENGIANTIENKIKELKGKDKKDVTEKDINDLILDIEKVQNKKLKTEYMMSIIGLIVGVILYAAGIAVPYVWIASIISCLVSLCGSLGVILDGTSVAGRITKQLDKIIDKYTSVLNKTKGGDDPDAKDTIKKCETAISLCQKAKENVKKNQEKITKDTTNIDKVF